MEPWQRNDNKCKAITKENKDVPERVNGGKRKEKKDYLYLATGIHDASFPRESKSLVVVGTFIKGREEGGEGRLRKALMREVRTEGGTGNQRGRKEPRRRTGRG